MSKEAKVRRSIPIEDSLWEELHKVSKKLSKKQGSNFSTSKLVRDFLRNGLKSYKKGEYEIAS